MAAFSARAREVTPALVRTAARNLEGRAGRGDVGARSRRSGPSFAASRRRRGSPGSPSWRGAAAAPSLGLDRCRSLPLGAAAPRRRRRRRPSAPVARRRAGAGAPHAPPVVPAAAGAGAPPEATLAGGAGAEPPRPAPAPLGRRPTTSARATVAAWPAGRRAERSTSPRSPRAITSPPPFLSDASVERAARGGPARPRRAGGARRAAARISCAASSGDTATLISADGRGAAPRPRPSGARVDPLGLGASGGTWISCPPIPPGR